MKTIRDIIGERQVFSVDKSATIQEVVEYVNEKQVGAVAICDDEDLVGVFSERDLLRRVVLKGLDPTKEKIEKVMTKNDPTPRAPRPSAGQARGTPEPIDLGAIG